MFLFFSLLFTGMYANWIRQKIIKLNALPGKEQEIARLTEKHNQLYNKYMVGYAEYIRPKKRTHVENITRQMLWICSIGLVLLVVLAYMSQYP